jgi:hypothetical protein
LLVGVLVQFKLGRLLQRIAVIVISGLLPRTRAIPRRRMLFGSLELQLQMCVDAHAVSGLTPPRSGAAGRPFDFGLGALQELKRILLLIDLRNLLV